MQTLEFTRALAEIVKEVRAAELVSLMQRWLKEPNVTIQSALTQVDKDQFSQLFFASHAGYDWLLRGEPTRKILQGLNAQELYEPARMGRILTSVTNSGQIVQLRQNPDLVA